MRNTEVIYSNSSTAQNDVKYLTGFDAPDPVVFINTQAEKLLLVPVMEKGRAINETYKNVNVLSYSDINMSSKIRPSISNYILEILKNRKIKKIKIDKDFPVEIYKALNKAVLIDVAELSVKKNRRKKSTNEIKALNYCQKITSNAMRLAIKMIEKSTIDNDGSLVLNKKKLSSEMVKIEVQKYLLDNSFFGPDIIIACGSQSADPHERGHGKLFANVPIVIDIFPRHEKTKYWGDMTRTICKGAPSNKLMKMYKAVKDAQKKAINSIKEGVYGSDIHKDIVECFNQAGFKTCISNEVPSGFIHGTGHGVGLDIHEQPRVNSSKIKLMEGDVITIEPGLYYPELGGIRIEDLVVVEKNGCSVLGGCSKKFIIN